MTDDLRDALRAEAARHRPDREAILARVAAGQAPERRARKRRTPLRVAGLATACALLLGTSVAGTWAAVGHYLTPAPAAAPTTTVSTRPSTPVPGPSGTGATASPAPSGGSAAAGGPHTPSGPASASAAGTAAGSTSVAPGQSPGPTRVQQGFLWSDGSVDPGSSDSWAQSDVTLQTAFTVTALDVTLRVALTAGVTTTGQWSTVPAQDLDVTVSRQGGFLLYEWTLKPGATLAPGTYAFAGQYDHAPGGRDAGRDSYAAKATGHGQPASVYGNFYPTPH
ncbi:hypothetical protein [Streptacidiphilus melanogenes]|uniref:hypothetical protein n=1 Tax=Streptacidiphilus melanogenes TaxID=411235 RepID=UPI0005A7E796|nr:hypothetical protein [Streptacidiphilus melanogenes]